MRFSTCFLLRGWAVWVSSCSSPGVCVIPGWGFHLERCDSSVSRLALPPGRHMATSAAIFGCYYREDGDAGGTPWVQCNHAAQQCSGGFPNPTTNERSDPQISLLPRLRSPQLEVPAASQGPGPRGRKPKQRRSTVATSLLSTGSGNPLCPGSPLRLWSMSCLLRWTGFPSAGCLDGVWAWEKMPDGEGGETQGDPFRQFITTVRTLGCPAVITHPKHISGLATKTASCSKGEQSKTTDTHTHTQHTPHTHTWLLK